MDKQIDELVLPLLYVTPWEEELAKKLWLGEKG